MLGKRIRDRRDSLKLSREFVAKKAGYGVGSIQRWESPKGDPRVSELRALAIVLGVSPSWFFEGSTASGVYLEEMSIEKIDAFLEDKNERGKGFLEPNRCLSCFQKVPHLAENRREHSTKPLIMHLSCLMKEITRI